MRWVNDLLCVPGKTQGRFWAIPRKFECIWEKHSTHMFFPGKQLENLLMGQLKKRFYINNS